jgi:hypothetical protein
MFRGLDRAARPLTFSLFDIKEHLISQQKNSIGDVAIRFEEAETDAR